MRRLFGAVLALIGLMGTTAQPTPPPLATISIVAPKATLRLEIARTESERETGLMYRTSLPAHTGMLFVFSQDAPIEFWMKNTLVPLDMVFVAVDDRVRSVAADVPATTPTTPDAQIPRRDGTAKYVIELPANEAAADGITIGTRLSIHLRPSRASVI